MMQTDRPLRALVTGATGFIGSRLVRTLLASGWEVTALVRPTSNCAEIPRDVSIFEHDGTTSALVGHVNKVRPDLIFHLAARFLSAHRSEDIAPLIADNILLSAQLFEAAAQGGVRGLINTGTCWQHYGEERRYSPVNLYAATKQAAEDLLLYYAEAVNLRSLTLELVDTYGAGDPRKKLFHLLRESAARGGVLEMSPGEQLIDLVHVDDAVNAYLVAAQRLLRPMEAAYECWGVTSSLPLPLRDVVELFRRLNGNKPEIAWGRRPYREREVMIPHPSPALPGWQPQIGLEAGLRRLLLNE